MITTNETTLSLDAALNEFLKTEFGEDTVMIKPITTISEAGYHTNFSISQEASNAHYRRTGGYPNGDQGVNAITLFMERFYSEHHICNGELGVLPIWRMMGDKAGQYEFQLNKFYKPREKATGK